MDLYLFVLVITFIHGTDAQLSTCGMQNKTAVNICSDNNIVAKSTVYIASITVPRFQQTECSCLITVNISIQVTFTFSFVDNIVSDTLSFKMNDNEITLQENEHMSDKGLNILTAFANETYSGGEVCLNVSSDIPFDIKCNKTEIKSSSSKATTTSTTTFISSSTTHLDQNIDKEGGDKLKIIIPVVASISAVICLVVLLLIVIYCRRRYTNINKKPEITKSDVTEKDDDYYMTENPMYETGDNPKHLDNSENDYHYVESDKQKKGTRHFHEKQSNEGHHYDYSTCLSPSQKANPALEKDITKAIPANVNLLDNENTYDKTSAIASHQFQGPNEYHHLGNVGSRKRTTVDTYNTIGHTTRSVGQDEEDDLSDYHITNARS